MLEKGWINSNLNYLKVSTSYFNINLLKKISELQNKLALCTQTTKTKQFLSRLTPTPTSPPNLPKRLSSSWSPSSPSCWTWSRSSATSPSSSTSASSTMRSRPPSSSRRSFEIEIAQTRSIMHSDRTSGRMGDGGWATEHVWTLVVRHKVALLSPIWSCSTCSWAIWSCSTCSGLTCNYSTRSCSTRSCSTRSCSTRSCSTRSLSTF